MKETFSYFKIKLQSTKIKYIFLVIVIYNFTTFIEVIFGKHNYNFYDIIIEQLGYLNLFHVVSFTFLLIICNICDNSIYNYYVYTRFKSKFDIYNIHIIFIICISIVLVMLINIQCGLECVGKVSFNNEWSEYFFYNIQGNTNAIYNKTYIEKIIKNITPITYVIITELLVVLYLSFIGILFYVLNIIIRKKAVSFVITLSIISLNLLMDSDSCIGKYLFTKNIYLIQSEALIEQNTIFIKIVLYWVIGIFILYFLGKLLTKKNDYKFEEKL